MSLLLWWLMLFGVWPLADPGHNDFTSSLVLLDLALHFVAMWVLLNREIDRRARIRSEREAIDALVAVVRSVVEEGHYDNAPEGLNECRAFEYGEPPALDPRCDCGWNEARQALDLYEAAAK